MKFTTHFEKQDKRLLCLLTAGMALVGLISWFVMGEKALLVFLILAVLLVVAAQIAIYRGTFERLEDLSRAQRYALKDTYRQIESLFSLFSLLRITAPLPPMCDWAIYPDFANLIVGTIRERKPRRVLELGSGISTIVAAYALKEVGVGELISLDHDRDFAGITDSNLRKHGLSEFARVVHAPLCQVVLQGCAHQWYDIKSLEGLRDIDLVIVDGPPGILQHLARYPALPLLWSHLRDDVVVLIDDARRADERKMTELWCREFPSLQAELVDTVMGAIILSKKKEKTSGISTSPDSPLEPDLKRFHFAGR